VFTLAGVMDDGINLAYGDSSEGTLQIVIQYCMVVITYKSFHCIDDVGRTPPVSTASAVPIVINIIPGI
jgi:hypothetical protein